MKERLLYPDICKFIAIFLVTWSHCAQCISGTTWTNFWGGSELDIAFNMPLFMLISGWFINLDKLRSTDFHKYFIIKFKRLIVPSIIWFLIHYLLFANKLDFSISNCYWIFYSFMNYYWYLNALFVCLCIILISVKLFKNNYTCICISTLFVLACPMTEIANINFMFPFIWAGYGLRKLLNTKYAVPFIIICAIIGFTLCPSWNSSYSVYLSPLKSLHFDLQTAISYIFRFTIGFCLSAVIIYFIKTIESTQIRIFARLGQYSLAIYTVSIAILSFVSIILKQIDIHNNKLFEIDIISFILCAIIVFVTILFSNICRKNSHTSLLFLGEA